MLQPGDDKLGKLLFVHHAPAIQQDKRIAVLLSVAEGMQGNIAALAEIVIVKFLIRRRDGDGASAACSAFVIDWAAVQIVHALLHSFRPLRRLPPTRLPPEQAAPDWRGTAIGL
ncbi:hypothetical protein D3C75_766750 [compost metagenome]